LIGAVVALAALGAATAGSGLRFTAATPDDLRAVASGAWQRFADAGPACAGRLDGLTVGVAWDLPDRARYEPEGALVLVRAPGTAANLQATLLHEFAHHAEHRCAMDATFQKGFVDAAGLPPGTPWRGGERWELIPSERFAEATVSFVLGEPPPHVLIRVTPREVRAVAAWAAGG
jgi:hypothetical protein